MNLYYLSIVLVIVCNLTYHIAQKATPQGINPVAALAATYATALGFTVILLFLYPSKTGIFEAFKQINWASYLLGFAIVGLELGFLMAYRMGWNVSTAALYSQIIVSVLLVPIGITLFKEGISFKNFLGILLSIVGVVLMSSK